MTYQFDLFFSYRRSATAGLWVKNHLYPVLRDRLNEIAPDTINLSIDLDIPTGATWPDALKHRLNRSKILLAVWSADYFRSNWCMAEWQSFVARERQLSTHNEHNAVGLVYPIRYADGDHYHPDAKNVQCKHDFRELSYPGEYFRQTEKYMQFDDTVRRMADELVSFIADVPPWQANFPISEPPALPDALITKPKL